MACSSEFGRGPTGAGGEACAAPGGRFFALGRCFELFSCCLCSWLADELLLRAESVVEGTPSDLSWKNSYMNESKSLKQVFSKNESDITIERRKRKKEIDIEIDIE